MTGLTPVVTATVDYEDWLRRQVDVLEADFHLKYRQMASTGFYSWNILYRWNISRANSRGDNFHEGDRGNGPGCGNGRDDASGTARAAGSDKRRRRSGPCVGIRPD